MATHAVTEWTVADYLAYERAARTKHEYYAGEIVAMSGVTLRHAAIVRNASGFLFNVLGDGPCKAYTSDVLIYAPVAELLAYPDLIVLCGEPKLLDAPIDTVLNPTVLIEVLSKSTEEYDRTIKLDGYRTLESLQTYLLVAQDGQQIEAHQRTADGWSVQVVSGPDGAVALPALGLTLPLAAVYRGLDLPPARPKRVMPEPRRPRRR